MSKKKAKNNPDRRSLQANWLPLTIIGLVAIAFFGSIEISVYKQGKEEADLAAEKVKFRDQFPGLEETISLSPEKKRNVVERMNKEFCSCKCGYTVASCLVADRDCPNRSNNLLKVKELINESNTQTSS